MVLMVFVTIVTIFLYNLGIALLPEWVMFLPSLGVPTMGPTSATVHLLLAFRAVPRNSGKGGSWGSSDR